MQREYPYPCCFSNNLSQPPTWHEELLCPSLGGAVILRLGLIATIRLSDSLKLYSLPSPPPVSPISPFLPPGPLMKTLPEGVSIALGRQSEALGRQAGGWRSADHPRTPEVRTR